MVKSQLIVLRVEPEMKQRIEQAADNKGLTVTTFILETVEKAVTKAEKEHPVARFRGVPTWFRACCLEASRGGKQGFYWVGRQLASHLADLEPYDAEDWGHELRRLESLIIDKIPTEQKGIVRILPKSRKSEWTGEEVWQWLYKNYPKCMDLIPKRRRDQFLGGFMEHIKEEEGINL